MKILTAVHGIINRKKKSNKGNLPHVEARSICHSVFPESGPTGPECILLLVGQPGCHDEVGVGALKGKYRIVNPVGAQCAYRFQIN